MTDPNPFLERIAKRATNSHGKAYEKKGALSLAARLTPASGAMVGAKGDMRLARMTGQDFLIESKSTTALSLPVKLEWLVKISEEAVTKGMHPALLLAFVTQSGKPKPHCDSEWIAMPKSVYLELLEQTK